MSDSEAHPPPAAAVCVINRPTDHDDFVNLLNLADPTSFDRGSDIMVSKGNGENDDVESPRFSAMRLMGHILTKGVQAGSVVGGALLLPALYCYNSQVETKKLAKLVTYTMAGGVALSGTLGLAKFVSMDGEGMQERAYRLKYNSAQNRLDRMNTVFGLFGAGAMGLVRGPDAYSILSGFSLGTAAAVLAHFITTDHKTDLGKIVHELNT